MINFCCSLPFNFVVHPNKKLELGESSKCKPSKFQFGLPWFSSQRSLFLLYLCGEFEIVIIPTLLMP